MKIITRIGKCMSGVKILQAQIFYVLRANVYLISIVMASVFNSTNKQIALTDSSFTGRWEDIQAYTSVINTLEIGTDTSGTAHLQWVNMDDDDFPSRDTSALVTDTFTFGPSQVVTKQFDTRTRWFRLYITGTGSSLNKIATTYKKAPTEIKLSDDSTNIVSVNLGDSKNSLYTILTDLSGSVLGTTNDAHGGEALYTHLADGSGHSLATTDNNRDIIRTLTETDVSFVFSTDGESTGNYGSLIVENNRFRLPKSTIPFKDGDVVRFAMGTLGDKVFSVDGAFGSPAKPEGILKITGTVRYREVESNHVQFELLVDKDMSEWFDQTVGFTNYDPSHFNDFDTMTAADYTRAVGVSGYAYLLDVSNGHVPTVDAYYAAFADQSGFDLSASGLILNPGQYPVDLRFYRGSLANDSTFTTLAEFQGYNNGNALNHNDISFDDPENPVSVRNIYGTVRGASTQILVGYDISTTGDTSEKVGFDSDTSFFITKTYWQDNTKEINDYTGEYIDVSFYTTGQVVLDVSSVGIEVTGGSGSIGNFHLVSYDLSVANDSLESLAVALRDNQNDNIGSTGIGETAYYYHSNRRNNTNVLFLVDTCFVNNDDEVTDFMRGLQLTVSAMETNTGASITSAVGGYNDGTYPVFNNSNTDIYTPQGSVLKTRDTNTTDWGRFDLFDPHQVGATSNFWKVLKDYSNQENTDTCLGTIFSPDLDAIVLFHYGDSSSSYEDRMGFDACSTFFDGIDKLVVTAEGNDITELLSFTGDIANIYRFPNNVQTFDQATGFHDMLARRLIGIKHVGNNSLMVHTTDVCGHSQAGTRTIVGAEHGEVALYYALADSCGTQLDTTKSNSNDTSLNAAYVSLVTKVNVQGTPLGGASTVNSERPLHITFDATFIQGKTFDFNVSGFPITLADLSNNNVILKHLGIANETAAPIWLKVYDMSVGYYMENSGAVLNPTTGNLDSSAFTLQDRLVYNLAVPGLDYRDFEFSKGVKFDNGVYVVASTNFLYDSYNFPPGNKHIYVHGSYEDIATS